MRSSAKAFFLLLLLLGLVLALASCAELEGFLEGLTTTAAPSDTTAPAATTTAADTTTAATTTAADTTTAATTAATTAPVTTAGTTAATTTAATTTAATTAPTTTAPVTTALAPTLGEIIYNTEKSAISVNDNLTPALFGATCEYSDGTVATVTLTYDGTLAAGETVTVILTATDGKDTKTVRISGVRIYGAPILTYDTDKTAVKDTDIFSAALFGAAATDSFGEALDVTINLEGEWKAGQTVTVLLSACDALGNTDMVRIEGMKVYGTPMLSYNEGRMCIKATDLPNAELFGVTALNSFGDALTAEVSYVGEFKAGKAVTIVIRVSDAVGNVASVQIENVKVYGIPTVEFATGIDADTDMKAVATVLDSFGEPLEVTVTYDGTLAKNERVTVTVVATDSAGNSVVDQHTYYFGHDAHRYVDDVCGICGQKRPYTHKDGYVYFGEYPQTLKADNVNVTAVTDSRGYYLGSDGYYYAMVTAKPWGDYYTYGNGAAVTRGTVYYFKVEPIRWRILSQDDESFFLLCDSIIAKKRFDKSSNNYAKSEIRAWLNGEFYNTAFTELQKQFVLTTLVDNSMPSTNPYACEDTEDKVFLLSTSEAGSSAYGFKGIAVKDANRKLQVSDYLRATGLWMCTDEPDYGIGDWWLRSPYFKEAIAKDIGFLGNDGRENVKDENNMCGIAPAIYIKKDRVVHTLGEISYDTSKTAISVRSALTPELFGATCQYSDGAPAVVAVSYQGTLSAGKTVTIILTVTDGTETKTATIEGVKIYGTPEVEFLPNIYEDTNMKSVATVRDSFGESLKPTVTYEGTLKYGERVTVTVKATDCVGNTVTLLKTYYVKHNDHAFQNGNCTICGERDVDYSYEGDYIYFGEYPQTLKADDVTITSVTDSRGYYLGSDGCYYAEVKAVTYGSGYTFANGDAVVSRTVYYFKVEPIRWRILSEDDGSILILCDSIIANMAHSYEGSNSYADSDVRAWLNEEFYNTAFSDLQKEAILATVVDNSPASTGSSKNPYVCEDTEDKVFLLSYAEATNAEYGFAAGSFSNPAREMQMSDYSRATYGWMTNLPDYYGNGVWWLRSPDTINGKMCAVAHSGHGDYPCSVESGHIGIVPALRIKK